MFNADRLRLARDVRGLKQSELAQRLGVKPSAVSQFEHGRSRPSESTLKALALALEFPIDFFAPTEGHENPPSFFRSLRSTSAGSRKQAEATSDLLHVLTSTIEQYVVFPNAEIPMVPLSDRVTPGEAAREVRRRWGLPGGPVRNMVRLLEQHGVVVARTIRGSDDIDAFSRPFEPRPIVVLAADKKDRARSRFDAAHELGHLVMHPHEEPATKAVEDEAQAFAAEFLMPEADIQRELPVRLDWDRLVKLKFRWGTSIKSLLMRSRTLNVMPESAYVRAMKIYSSRGWNRGEPGDLGTPEIPRLLQRAVELLEGSGIGILRLAEQSRLHIAEVERLLGEAGDVRPRVSLEDSRSSAVTRLHAPSGRARPQP
ncbi:MAG TPA: XRE family transcriptional regulator [Actinomycetota bacterium]|nr:XRE family transcriptional regulator [Actinomycetota bacterium]